MHSINDGKTRKILNVFTLVMINVIAVDSLRTLPISAVYGFSLVFYYLLAAVVFFIPTALVTAELATGWPNTGGVYVWVREAFGPRWAFLTIWLQWIYNVVWYPTIFSFMAATIAYLIDPQLADNKLYILGMILTMFWVVTLINCLGLRASSLMSTIGTLVGTIIPMLFIICLGGYWLYTNHPSQVSFSAKAFFPDLTKLNNLAFLTGILFGLMGMEMSAVHAEEVKNPQRDYPRALIYSVAIILFTLIAASLAIAIVVPNAKLSVVTGLIDAFSIFFNSYQLGWMIPVIAALIIVGSLGGVGAWILGPTRGLLVATRDSQMLPYFQKVNKHGAPVGLLLFQGLIATLLTTVFLFMPSVNSSYWVLTALTSQLALIFYILMFAAALRLRYKKPLMERAYRIPGGNIGMWIVAMLGIGTCILAIVIGFLPPEQLHIENIYIFEGILFGGIFILCIPPFIIYALRKSAAIAKSRFND